MNKTAYLYRYYAINKFTQLPELLYAGITDNLERRDKQHSLSSSWHKNHDYKIIQEFPSRKAALVSEGRAISLEAPKYNIYHNKMKDLTLNLNGVGQVLINGIIAIAIRGTTKVISTEARRHFTVRMDNWS